MLCRLMKLEFKINPLWHTPVLMLPIISKLAEVNILKATMEVEHQTPEEGVVVLASEEDLDLTTETIV